MKSILTIVFLIATLSSYSQKKMFKVYDDSSSLVLDANYIVTAFTARVNAIKHVMDPQPLAILNTKPFLIFYSPKAKKVNLPIWYQVIPEQKNFFTQLAGSEKEGKRMFGYFFNGFYLAHELGHALQHAVGKSDSNLYRNEYTANTIAILYWRRTGYTNELKGCYKYAKQIVKQLPNPVPAGEDPVKYFNEHYTELGADPYKYGFFQFAQFVKIYEDTALENFDTYIQQLLAIP